MRAPSVTKYQEYTVDELIDAIRDESEEIDQAQARLAAYHAELDKRGRWPVKEACSQCGGSGKEYKSSLGPVPL